MNTNDEWYTPREIVESLGEFDLDPASSIEAYRINQSAKRFYTLQDNGLKQKWEGRVWLNPPYSNPLNKEFMKKMAEHNKGIALVFSKIEAQWFHDVVFPYAAAVKFLYNRVQFHRPDGTIGGQPRNGSMLVAYGKEDAIILMHNRLKGKFVFL